jgi:hypothetical protein
MKKKTYLILLLAAVAIMTSSNTGCGGNDAKTSNDSTVKKADAGKSSDTTHTKPIHN